MRKIVHIINSLEFGGAEMMLANLLARSDRDRFDPVVVLLIKDLTLADRIERLGIPIRVIGMKPGIPDPRGILSLARLLRQEKPQLIQTWMDHSNLIGGLATRLAGVTPLVWGIHHSNHLPGYTKRSTLLTVSACARLSRRVPTRIICCSEHARALYVQRGFMAAKITVIPNGFDTEAYRPDPSARLAVRRELGVEPETPLVGLVARFDPLKDHQTFLLAAGALKDRHPKAHFLLCGEGVDDRNIALTSTIRSLGLENRCHLLGPRRDIPRIQASLDITASSSISEAFPLTVGEAMACGTPCVVTDVGDSALMVGDTGRVVPPRDHAALADALGDILSLSPAQRFAMGEAARRQTVSRFDLSAVTRRYENFYDSIIADKSRSEESVPIESGSVSTPVTSSR
ncbi:glycosyltransferase [Singulisphaera sp. Ch08]|uniref:Glycosyltransferase n=1 Tax=Singulisphaera sp. Ch08 TaxID=3120278 RepID=A0AAU7C7C2_9BACT